MSSLLTARLRRPLANLRRDLRAATAGLRGEQPPPFHPRDGSAWSSPSPAGPALSAAPALSERPTATWRVLLRDGDVEHAVDVPPGSTILGAAQSAGIDLAHSCAVGGCGTCRHVLVSGRVVMQQPNCLTDAERADGSVLLCVGIPLEPTVLERTVLERA